MSSGNDTVISTDIAVVFSGFISWKNRHKEGG
jgi:hypothetical protein